MLSAIAAMVKAYPYQEEGYRGGDIFGEAGLNAVSIVGIKLCNLRVITCLE